MTSAAELKGLDAARALAALSPETKAALERSVAMESSQRLRVSAAFHAIGAAIGSKRSPVADSDKKKLFAFAEELLTKGTPEVSNAIATCLLEQVWTAARESGFDFATVDPYLGRESRNYLIAWDDFQKTKTKGLTRN